MTGQVTMEHCVMWSRSTRSSSFSLGLCCLLLPHSQLEWSCPNTTTDLDRGDRSAGLEGGPVDSRGELL